MVVHLTKHRCWHDEKLVVHFRHLSLEPTSSLADDLQPELGRKGEILFCISFLQESHVEMSVSVLIESIKRLIVGSFMEFLIIDSVDGGVFGLHEHGIEQRNYRVILLKQVHERCPKDFLTSVANE